jgi:hypothetical protein
MRHTQKIENDPGFSVLSLITGATRMETGI